MAGIGFKLRKLSDEGTLVETMWAYAAAGVITSGPWILSVLALGVAAAVARSAGLGAERFMAILVYTYAFSMILTAAQQNLITRYLADRLYQGDAGRHLPTLVASLAVNVPLLGAVAGLTCLSLPLSGVERLLSTALFVLVGSIWLAMVFLGSVRAYASIVGAFFWGTVVFLVVLPLGAARLGELVFLVAAVLGQGTTLFVMLGILVREFSLDIRWDFGFLGYAQRYPYLGLCGLILNLGVWSGVLVYWASDRAQEVAGLRVYGPHDSAAFLALLSTIVASAMFFIRTETEFYDGYRAFFGGINHGRVRYSELVRRKEEMRSTLQRGLADLVRMQGVVTLLFVLFAHQLASPFHLAPLAVQLLPACAVGAFLLVLSQFVVMILYYYEAYGRALACALALVVGNLTMAWMSLSWPPHLSGWGLALGSGMALILGLVFLGRCLEDLEFTTFMSHPMPGLDSLTPAPEALSCTMMKDGKWLQEVGQNV